MRAVQQSKVGGSVPIPESPAREARRRYEFYRDGFRRLIGGNLALVVCLTISLVLNYVQYSHKPIIQNFAVDNSGRLTPIFPLDQPMVTQDTVLELAGRTATKAFEFNFVDYREQINDLASLFTHDGYQNYVNALVQSGNLDKVKQDRLISSAVESAAPVVVRSGENLPGHAGIFTWEVEVPVIMTLQGQNSRTPQSMLVTLTIIRVPQTINPKGIAVDQFIAREGQ